MGKRFVIEGEKEEKVLLAVEFSAIDTSLQLYCFTPKKGLLEKLEAWQKNEDKLPKHDELIVRTIADQNLLPEEIKVKDVGKVRFIENEWAESLIQTRLVKGFDSELKVLQESVALLDDYSEDLFQECSNFWKRLLDYKKEVKSLDNAKIDNYKLQLDILFEALKALRKDHRKEFDSNSIANRDKLNKMLDDVEESKSENKNIFGRLKEIRAEYNKMAMRHNHKNEIDKRINSLFDKAGTERKKQQNSNAGKRVNDLEGIISKMNKALDWKIRELQREEKNLQFADHAFQEKLLLSKIELIKKDIKEIEGKISDINKTLDKLKK
ncbi:MAG: hypothetical protein ACPG4Y_00995 [Chitinophagales bacterium]